MGDPGLGEISGETKSLVCRAGEESHREYSLQRCAPELPETESVVLWRRGGGACCAGI